MLARMGRFAHTHWARMSSGQYCLIRDLGLVKGGKGLRHHEVVLTLSWHGVIRFLIAVARETSWREQGTAFDVAAIRPVAQIAAPSSSQSSHQPDVAV